MKQSQRKQENPVGFTASSGYQVGVRRTLPFDPRAIWEVLTSSQGLELWLGPIDSLSCEAGETYVCSNGTKGELRVVKPFQQLRLTWQPREWNQPSTLQIRLISNNSNRTTLSFHQEKLDNVHRREEMKHHWERVIVALAETLSSS